jgi:integrase
VFASLDGTPDPFRECGRVLSRALKQAGLPALSWHDLRHVFASVAISEGTSVAYLSRVLGHSSPAVTMTTSAHAFAAVEHEDAHRERMESALGSYLQ